jgi:hypothetical protein
LACEARALESPDPALKETFERLRDMWLSIGNLNEAVATRRQQPGWQAF